MGVTLKKRLGRLVTHRMQRRGQQQPTWRTTRCWARFEEKCRLLRRGCFSSYKAVPRVGWWGNKILRPRPAAAPQTDLPHRHLGLWGEEEGPW